MTNVERTGQRDLTISGWHRAAFYDDAKAFDLDLVGICGRCGNPLYAIEATRAHTKTTTWTNRTALRLNIPAYLVQYQETDDYPRVSMRVTQIYPDRRDLGDRQSFEFLLKTLRCHHDQVWHGIKPADNPVWTAT